jgi:hypothetical protein
MTVTIKFHYRWDEAAMQTETLLPRGAADLRGRSLAGRRRTAAVVGCLPRRRPMTAVIQEDQVQGVSIHSVDTLVKSLAPEGSRAPAKAKYRACAAKSMTKSTTSSTAPWKANGPMSGGTSPTSKFASAAQSWDGDTLANPPVTNSCKSSNDQPTND